MDSLAEVHFFTRNYAEAEKQFLAGAAKYPEFQLGIDRLKAAASRLAAGDAKGAEALATEHMDLLRRKEIRTLQPTQQLWKRLVEASAAGGPDAAVAAIEKTLMPRPAPAAPL